MREAPIPSSRVMWLRTTARTREEARRTAVRSATLIQAALVAAAIVIAIVVLGATVPAVRIDLRPLLTIPVFAFIAWVILAPVAVYFAVRGDRVIDFHNHFYPGVSRALHRDRAAFRSRSTARAIRPAISGRYNIAVRGHRDIAYREACSELGVDTQRSA
jgi:hypothetical protein